MKAHISPNFLGRTVLSNSTFEYVELWLRNQKGGVYKEALFYWQQSRAFYKASEDLPLNSKPLTSYYSILNAAKALLVIKGVDVEGISHGVASSRQDVLGNIRKDEITYVGSGALGELSRFLNESLIKQKYKVYDLL